MDNIRTTGIAVLVALGMSWSLVAQGKEVTIKVTTLEIETVRNGACDQFLAVPDELLNLRGYTQETEDSTCELGTNRWLPGTMVVNKGDVVTLEIYGVRGRDHNTQIFRPGWELFVNAVPEERVSGIGAADCVGDADTLVGIGPNGQPCFFVAARGEVHKVTFTADKKGTWLLHCHTHGTSMNANIVVLNPPENANDD